LFDFDMLGLKPILSKTLATSGFTEPTPIQNAAIPLALDGHDILGLAQTGTGKTLAFGLPLMEHLLALHGKPEPKTARALILAPTRELVNQIADQLRVFTNSDQGRHGRGWAVDRPPDFRAVARGRYPRRHAGPPYGPDGPPRH